MRSENSGVAGYVGNQYINLTIITGRFWLKLGDMDER